MDPICSWGSILTLYDNYMLHTYKSFIVIANIFSWFVSHKKYSIYAVIFDHVLLSDSAVLVNKKSSDHWQNYKFISTEYLQDKYYEFWSAA